MVRPVEQTERFSSTSAALPTLFVVSVYLIHGVQVGNSKVLLGRSGPGREGRRPGEGGGVSAAARSPLPAPRRRSVRVGSGRFIEGQGKSPFECYQAAQVMRRFVRIDSSRRAIRRRLVDLMMDPAIQNSDARTHLEILLKPQPGRARISSRPLSGRPRQTQQGPAALRGGAESRRRGRSRPTPDKPRNPAGQGPGRGGRGPRPGRPGDGCPRGQGQPDLGEREIRPGFPGPGGVPEEVRTSTAPPTT